MKEIVLKGTLKTEIICDPTRNRVFEVCRDFSEGKLEEGETCLLITLCPTIDDVTKQDLSGMHYQNHIGELGVKKTHFVFLDNRICTSSRLSFKDNVINSDNLEYIARCIERYKGCRIIVAWGVSGSKNKVLLATKAKILDMISKARPGETIWELAPENDSKRSKSNGNRHILYMGIRCPYKWVLVPYTIPEELRLENALKHTESTQKSKVAGENGNEKKRQEKAKEEG